MDQFHPHEQNNKVALTGNVDDVIMRRGAIKLSEGPKIMIAVPIGGKPLSTVLDCPQCRARNEERTKMEVHDGFIAQAVVPFQFLAQHMNWLPPLNVTLGYTFKTGLLSAEARQIMTQECLKIPTVKYIFYVDDDMIIPPMGLYTLYNDMERYPELGMVTGVYSTRQNPTEPLVYTEHGRGAAWDFEMGVGAGLTDIMGAGAGCLLARVDAIKDWQEANPDTPIWCDSSEYPASNGGRVTWGHDVRFVRNLREAGWRCCVDGKVLCGHYDLKTNQVFSVPADAPGFKKRNVNTEHYWDAVYGSEGFDTWRKYEGMFSYITEQMPMGARVFELGCGPGVLGQRLTAVKAVQWEGVDFSEVAVTQARARYLRADQVDVRTMDVAELTGYDVIVATELLEHLSWEDCKKLLEKINASEARQLFFGTPWECMPPEEVPEHAVLINNDWLDAAKGVLTRYECEERKKVDDHHVVTVWVKKG